MELMKVTNGEWLMTQMGEHIERFAREMDIPGIHGPSLFAHFARVAQYGGEREEFWVVLDDNGKPIAFANWNTLGLPHVSKVYMGFMHSWARPEEATRMLGEEYLRFGEKHRAVWYVYETMSEAITRLLRRELGKKGFELKETGIINCISWRAGEPDYPASAPVA
jgi:hypothetical protein